MTDLAEGQFEFFYEVTSEGREFPSLLHSSDPRELLQPQPQLNLVPDTSRDTESEIKISIASDVTH